MLNPAPGTAIALFLFAHQDDEFTVFKVIEDCVQRGQRPICFFFTAGDHGGQSAKIRCQESLSVLKQLGVSSQQICFIGEEHGIPDGKLHEHLNLALSEAEKLIASLSSPVQSLYVPAWEGGHQDHDAVNILGRVLASKLDCLSAAWQSPFYHGCGMPWILYKVLSPLAENGTVLTQPLSIVERLRYVKLCFTYKSQLKTWVGLLPFVTVNYCLSDARQIQQAVPAPNCLRKPHQGLLLYEKRKFCSYEELAACGQRFLNEHLGDSDDD